MLAIASQQFEASDVIMMQMPQVKNQHSLHEVNSSAFKMTTGVVLYIYISVYNLVWWLGFYSNSKSV